MAIVDTAVIIDLAKGNTAAFEAVKPYTAKNGGLKISSATFFELAGGASGLTEKKRQVLSAFKCIEFGAAQAEKAGEIYRLLKSQGRDIGVVDCQIAGSALCENEELITPDAHFQRVPGLKVIRY